MSIASAHAAAADDPVADVPLIDLPFCVVDLETTGGSPGRSRITEIGAVRQVGGRVGDTFSTLVNPEQPIPAVVTEITGIDDAMVRDAPPLSWALDQFTRFAGEAVLVAHNAPFDLRFLNYERRRLAGDYFGQPWLDTLTLSRRLLAEEGRRHDLRSLAAWAGTGVRPNHRALDDAQATAEVLTRLIEIAADRGIHTLADVRALVGPPEAQYSRAFALCEDLPSSAGVYILRDRGGDPLQIAAARNLRREVRRRVLAAGIARDGAPPVEVDRVDHEVHGSRLGALLRADELGRRHGVGGVSLRVPGRYLVLLAGARGLRVSGRIPDDALAAYGPLSGERVLRSALECLRAVYPLSDLDPGALRRSQTEMMALFDGEPRALGLLGERVAEAAAAGRFDPATVSGRVRLAAVTALMERLAEGRRVRERVAALVEPAAEQERVEIFLTHGGAVARRFTVEPAAWRPAVEPAVIELLGKPPAAGPVPLRQRVAATLIEERLMQRAAHPAAVRLAPGWGAPQLVAAIGLGVAAVAAERAAAEDGRAAAQ